MTTILQLPEEILLSIFDEFDFEVEELREFQVVCRAWYRPAHLKLLKRVSLHRPIEIERFIAGFDSNPNPEFLNAVHTLYLYNSCYDCPPPVQYRLSRENTAKLFFRLPNLQEIHFEGDMVFFDNFDDQLCKTFWEKCPKLDNVEVQPDCMEDDIYFKMLQKIRYLSTKLHVRDNKYAERFGTLQEFITSFPHLRNVGDFTGRLDSFRKFLPVFDQLQYLQHLALYIRSQDDINYADTYLAEHGHIVNMLSNITHLDMLLFCRGISAESFDFFKKYLTGLIVLSIGSRSPQYWTDLQQTLFCNNTLDLAVFVKNSVRFHGWIDFTALSKCLPTIIEKVFRQVPPPYTNKAQRVLHVELSQSNVNPNDMATLNIEWWRLKRLIKIAFNDRPGLDEITADTFVASSPIRDVDCYILDIDRRGQLDYYDYETTMEMYNDMLGRMPSLKEVFLDIPLSFVETKLTPDQYKVLPKVEDVTLKATADARFQTLLDGFFYSFPNLKRLNIYYFSGIWKKDMGEFQLELPKYELETLVLDVTTVRTKMKNTLDTKSFVLEIEFIEDSSRYIYMVSIEDLSFEEITVMNDINCTNDLYGLTRGKDYYRVHITINRLQTLKLCLSKYNWNDEKEEYNQFNYTRFSVETVTIFSEDDW